jgi:hypothetical protein
MDCRSRQNYPRRQTRAPSVRFHTLETGPPTEQRSRRVASQKMPAFNAGCARQPGLRRMTSSRRIDFRACHRRARVLKEEEPLPCVRCGKPFGVNSTSSGSSPKWRARHPRSSRFARIAVSPGQREASTPPERRRAQSCARPTTVCASAEHRDVIIFLLYENLGKRVALS